MSAQSDTAVRQRTRHITAPPKRCKVLLHNDDYTTQDFVVDILIEVFRTSEEDAIRIMLAVHV